MPASRTISSGKFEHEKSEHMLKDISVTSVSLEEEGEARTALSALKPWCTRSDLFSLWTFACLRTGKGSENVESIAEMINFVLATE